MATYLATAVIGTLRLQHGHAAGVPSWTAVDPTVGSAPEVRKTGRIVRFFERKFGPYPFDALGGIVDPSSAGFALETQTRPLYTSVPTAGLLAHELAHQWFGDLRQPATRWRDLCGLNEGFATFAEWIWQAHEGGPGLRRHFKQSYATPAKDHLAWDPPPGRVGGPKRLFAPSVYFRGAMTLEALRERIGSHDFYTVLRDWTAAHRYGNATGPPSRPGRSRSLGARGTAPPVLRCSPPVFPRFPTPRRRASSRASGRSSSGATPSRRALRSSSMARARCTGSRTPSSRSASTACPGTTSRWWTDSRVDRRLPAVLEAEVPFYPGLEVGVPSVPELVETLADGRYDLVHVTAPGPAGIGAALAAGVSGTGLVASHHTELDTYAAVRGGDPRLAVAMRVVLSGLYGRSRRVLSPSASADHSLEELGVLPERIARWERGVDVELFDPAKRDRGSLPGEITVLYAGRIAREKGIDLLADSYEAARERDPRLHLVIAGGGPEEDWLRARLGDRATFLGWLDRPTLARAYASADLFLFCSRTDTYGQVLTEAQASGLAVVAVGEGGPATLIHHRRTGWLCAPDAGELATAVAELASSRFLRARLAAAEPRGGSGPKLGREPRAARRRLRPRAWHPGPQACARSGGLRAPERESPLAWLQRRGWSRPRPATQAGVAPSARPPAADERADDGEPSVDLDDPSLYLNRELSWLDFNDRVLQLAGTPTAPPRADQLLRDLRDEPGRVLHGPRRQSRRPRRAGRDCAAPTAASPTSCSTRSPTASPRCETGWVAAYDWLLPSPPSTACASSRWPTHAGERRDLTASSRPGSSPP